MNERVGKLFERNRGGGYRNTKHKVSWRYDEDMDVVHFQGSVEREDWEKNFNFIPWPVRINKVWFWTSLGFWLAWREVLPALKLIVGRDTEFVAYSHGCPIASYASAYFRRKAHLFGSPRFLVKPSKKALDLFDDCTFYDCSGDIVTLVPPWADRGRYVFELGGTFHFDNYPEVPTTLKITGHSWCEYQERISTTK